MLETEEEEEKDLCHKPFLISIRITSIQRITLLVFHLAFCTELSCMYEDLEQWVSGALETVGKVHDAPVMDRQLFGPVK